MGLARCQTVFGHVRPHQRRHSSIISNFSGGVRAQARGNAQPECEHVPLCCSKNLRCNSAGSSRLLRTSLLAILRRHSCLRLPLFAPDHLEADEFPPHQCDDAENLCPQGEKSIELSPTRTLPAWIVCFGFGPGTTMSL